MHSTRAEREHERVGAIMSVAFGVYWETASGLVSRNIYLLEKWFPLWGERAHSLKLF